MNQNQTKPGGGSDTPETDAYIGEDNEDDMTEGEIAMCEFAREMERSRNEWRTCAMMKMITKTLSCMWCGEIVHAPTGYDPEKPLTQKQREQAYQEHTMICTAHPIREVFDSIRNLRDVKGRHHSEQAYNKLVAMLPESKGTES